MAEAINVSDGHSTTFADLLVLIKNTHIAAPWVVAKMNTASLYNNKLNLSTVARNSYKNFARGWISGVT